MANMTLSIPEKLYREMSVHSELKWSNVARQAFEKKLQELHWMDQVLAKSELSETHAARIGHALKGGIRKRFG